MRIDVKVRFITDEGEVCICKGCAELLRLLEDTGSVARAAERMGLSLSKAWKLVDNAERTSGHTLITRQQGGKGGGRSELTDEARKLLSVYDEKVTLLKGYAEEIGEDLP